MAKKATTGEQLALAVTGALLVLFVAYLADLLDPPQPQPGFHPSDETRRQYEASRKARAR